MSIGEKLEVRVKLLPEQSERCEKVAHSRGQTKIAFATAAVLAEIAVGEEELRIKKRKRVRSDEQEAIESGGSAPAPGTFSLRDKGNKIENDDDEKYQAAPPAATAPVVVNVGNTGQNGGGNAPDIGWLATFVLDGPTYMRDSRMRTAVDMIRASCKTDEERTDVANKLDVELAKREPKNEQTPFNRSARVAYDKLKNFFK